MATTVYTYDAAGQITDLDEVNAAITEIANYTMGYDAIGELTQQTDHGSMTVFSYDQLGQLTSGDSTSQTYTASGNRTGDTTLAGNEVTFDGTYSYAYDQEGNETLMYDASVTWAYSYDNDNHMTEALETNSSAAPQLEAQYKYDAFGNMTEQDVTTWTSMTPSYATTKFVLDGWNPAKAGATGQSGWNAIADLNGSGSLITHYVWGDGIGQLFGRFDTSLASDPTGFYSTMTDPNGSVRNIINNSGAYIATVQYDAFGNVIGVTSPGAYVADPGDYLGHYTYDSYHYDAATGYYDVNARQYSSASGRWLQQDPMGFDAGDSNLYRYVNNCPMETTDPSGMIPPTDDYPRSPYDYALADRFWNWALGSKKGAMPAPAPVPMQPLPPAQAPAAATVQERNKEFDAKVRKFLDNTIVNSKNGMDPMQYGVALDTLIVPFEKAEKGMTPKLQVRRYRPELKDYGIDWSTLKYFNEQEPEKGVKLQVYQVLPYPNVSKKELYVIKAPAGDKSRSYNCHSYTFGASSDKIYGKEGAKEFGKDAAAVKGPLWLGTEDTQDATDDFIKGATVYVPFTDVKKGDIVVFWRDNTVGKEKGAIHTCWVSDLK